MQNASAHRNDKWGRGREDCRLQLISPLAPLILRGGPAMINDKAQMTNQAQSSNVKSRASNENHPHLNPLPSRERRLPGTAHNSPGPSYLKRGTRNDK